MRVWGRIQVALGRCRAQEARATALTPTGGINYRSQWPGHFRFLSQDHPQLKKADVIDTLTETNALSLEAGGKRL